MSQPKFKSRFEQQFALLLKKLGVEYSYEKGVVSYVLRCDYKPDFRVGDIIIETKGLFDSADRRKHLAIKEQNPDVDIRFVFLRDNRITKTSKTRYSDWCEKHGFKYHVGLGVPEAWLFEAFGHKSKTKNVYKTSIKTTKNKKHTKVHRKKRPL